MDWLKKGNKGKAREFHVGSRIRMVKDRDGAKAGMVGTIVTDMELGDWGVKFDSKFNGGHNLNGKCEFGYGHWIAPEEMKLLGAQVYGHLLGGSEDYGKVGTPTKMHDCNGKNLFVGDAVETFDSDDKSYGKNFVVEQDNHQFVMGIACDCEDDGRITGGWHVRKTRSYAEISDGEKVGCLTYHAESKPKFEVGQIYRVGELPGESDRAGNIIKIVSSDTGGYSIGYITIRGTDSMSSYSRNSVFSKSLTLLTGSEISEAIRKWDADHAKKPEPEYNEIKRRAKPGEYIKLTEAPYSFDRVGDILKMDADDHVLGKSHTRDTGDADFLWCYMPENYVVLEGYKPKGKHSYTAEQIAEAKRIVLDTIREYAEKDEQIIIEHSGKSADDQTAFAAFVIHHDTDMDMHGFGKEKQLSFKAEMFTAKCSDGDEPNEWIGKCVALCKALHKPIPAFIMGD